MAFIRNKPRYKRIKRIGYENQSTLPKRRPHSTFVGKRKTVEIKDKINPTEYAINRNAKVENSRSFQLWKKYKRNK